MGRWNKLKPEISLSPKAVELMNRMLSDGKRVQIDFDRRTGKLKIYEVARLRTEYEVMVAAAGR